MKCEHCRRPVYAGIAYDRARQAEMIERTHADVEQVGHRCPECGRIFCGCCCLSEWEGMKKKTGLSGPALAARLEADPEACFTEMPRCPYCKECVEEVADGLPPVPALPAGAGGKNPLIELMGAGLIAGPLVLVYCYFAWDDNPATTLMVWAASAAILTLWSYLYLLFGILKEARERRQGRKPV